MTTPRHTATPALQRILTALGYGKLSVEEIAANAFVSESTLTCGGYLKALRNAGLIHISGWRKSLGTR